MTRTILGMAKSSLDLRGAKAQRLELDLLRLVHAVEKLRASGEDAQGYLLVMTPTQAERVQVWLSKYEADGTVVVLVAEPEAGDLEALRLEKAGNVEGMLAAIMGQEVAGRSSGALGQRLAEELLQHLILEREPAARRADRRPPFGIQWDYFGVTDATAE